MTAPLNRNEFAFKLPEMLSYHSTWDDADYEPAQPARAKGWFSRLVTLPTRMVTEFARRQRVMSELSQMSNRDLADMGLSRHDIGHVFDQSFAADYASRGFGRGCG